MRTSFLEFFFPRFCLGCGYVGTYICSRCESKMKKIKRARCFYCKGLSPFGLTHPKCHRNKGLDGHLSLYEYDGLFTTLLLASKYKGAHLVLRELLSFPQEKSMREIDEWNVLFKPILVSVPLHAQRIKERGFNQSEIITQKYYCNSRCIKEKLLERIVNTEHLANIGNKHNRKNHIRGAFQYIGNTVPQATLLIDDVITSGATILECTKTLKESGVQTVLAFSLAKG